MNPFRLIAASVLVSMCLAASGCAPGESASVAEVVVPPPEGDLSLFAFTQREAAIVQHIVYQNNEARRVLEETLLLIPNTRAQSKPGQRSQLGCRTYRKIGPNPDDKSPTHAESFTLSHKCVDGVSLFARVEMRGDDEYQIVYLEPIPKQDEAREIGFPASIAVDSRNTTFDARFPSKATNPRDGSTFSPKDNVGIARVQQFRIELSSTNEQQLIYRASLEQRDRFAYSVGVNRRQGELHTTLTDALFAVDRKTKKVVSQVHGLVEIESAGSQWLKDANGRRFQEMPFEIRDYSVTGLTDLTFAKSLCDYADSSYVVRAGRDQVTDETTVEFSKGVAKAGELILPEVKACKFDGQTRSYNPVFAQALEGLFF